MRSTDFARMVPLTKRQAELILSMIEYCESDWYLISREAKDVEQAKAISCNVRDIRDMRSLLEWAEEE